MKEITLNFDWPMSSLLTYYFLLGIFQNEVDLPIQQKIEIGIASINNAKLTHTLWRRILQLPLFCSEISEQLIK